MPPQQSNASTSYTKGSIDSTVHSIGCPQSSDYKKIKRQPINGSQDLGKLLPQPCFTCDPKGWTEMHSQRATTIEARTPTNLEPPTPTSFIDDERSWINIRKGRDVTARNDSEGEEETVKTSFCGLGPKTKGKKSA